jgi:hypothetical protein
LEIEEYCRQNIMLPEVKRKLVNTKKKEESLGEGSITAIGQKHKTSWYFKI